jgi:hypothetical protein
MNKEQLQEKLALHKKWLNDEEGGQRADLQRATLRGADLRDADLQRADLRGANLRGADLRDADLQRADLQRADLQRADLQRADLRGADLRGADLQRADLRGANLRGADLQRADLRGADHIKSFGPMPTSGRMVYAVKHDSGWMVQAGCFWGTLDELEAKVISSHNCPTYLAFIAMMRVTDK